LRRMACGLETIKIQASRPQPLAQALLQSIARPLLRQTLIYFGRRDKQGSFPKTMSCSGNLALRARALTPNFIILCVTTWSLLNTTILDRSATTVSLLFGSSASQDVLQILYYQFGDIASHLSSILSSFFAGLGGDACGGQHLRRDARRGGRGSRNGVFGTKRRRNRRFALTGFPAFPKEHERAGDIDR